MPLTGFERLYPMDYGMIERDLKNSAIELSCARWTFVDLQLEQREPSGRRKRTALEELTKAALRFCKAFDTFESEGRPGLEVLKYGAEHHCLEVKNALERVQPDLMRTDLEGAAKSSPSIMDVFKLKRRDVGSAEKEELSRRRRKLYERKQANDLLLFAYQDWDFRAYSTTRD